eukprot:EG_transcript_8273
MNYNVIVTLVFSFLAGLADGICNSTVTPALIFLLTSSNALVGVVEALAGTGEALAAIPIGLIVDRASLKRQIVLRWGAFVGVLAVCLTVVAVYYETFFAICVAYFLTGIWTAFGQVPVEAIFADSVPTGSRSGIYTLEYAMILFSQATGPIIAIASFYYLGNHWTVNECRNVLYIGCAVGLIAALVQALFLDSKTLGHESEAIQVVSSPASGVPSPTNEEPDKVDDEAASPEPDPELMKKVAFGCIDAQTVPWIISVSNVVTGLASGMTIKFFPLFFQNEAGLSPIAVNAIFVVSPLTIALTSTTIQPISRYCGRIETILLIRAIGIGLLVAMAVLKQYWRNPAVTIPLYIVRTALMNSVYPLTKSVMMDFIPKRSRGKWTAVNSIASFGWSGSAVLGGWLVDVHGYGFSFHITAAVQGVAAALWVLLLPIVPRETHHISTAATADVVVPPEAVAAEVGPDPAPPRTTAASRSSSASSAASSVRSETARLVP